MKPVICLIFYPLTNHSRLKFPIKISDKSTISIWGFSPEIYYYLDKIPSTQDAITQYAMIPHRYQYYFKDRYLNELKSKMPDYFIDSTGSDSFVLNDSDKVGYQSFPELKELIDKNYKLISKIQMNARLRGILIFKKQE